MKKTMSALTFSFLIAPLAMAQSDENYDYDNYYNDGYKNEQQDLENYRPEIKRIERSGDLQRLGERYQSVDPTEGGSRLERRSRYWNSYDYGNRNCYEGRYSARRGGDACSGRINNEYDEYDSIRWNKVRNPEDFEAEFPAREVRYRLHWKNRLRSAQNETRNYYLHQEVIIPESETPVADKGGNIEGRNVQRGPSNSLDGDKSGTCKILRRWGLSCNQ